MPLGAAAFLFFALAGGAAAFIHLYRKRKKARFIVLAAIASLIALAMLAYAVMTLIFIAAV